MVFAQEADHLLLTRIVTQPDKAESFSIYNPTDTPIDLSNYYVCDDEDYYKMQTEFPNNIAPSHWINGFTAQFPSISIDAYDTLTIVLHANYSDYYGESFSPDLVMYVDQDNSMIETKEGSFGEPVTGNDDPIPKLDNDQELLILFYWDGDFSNLIQDVDYFLWGAYQTPINKTGISTYQDDTPIESQLFFDTEAEVYYAYSRIGTNEMDETQAGGNGITEHDETSENFRASWEIIPLFNLGCTNQDAPNYDPYAEVDDGSCLVNIIDIINGNYSENSIVSTSGLIAGGLVTDNFKLINIQDELYNFLTIISLGNTFETSLECFLPDNIISIPCYDIITNPYYLHYINITGKVSMYQGEYQLELQDHNDLQLTDIYSCTDSEACNYNNEATIDKPAGPQTTFNVVSS